MKTNCVFHQEIIIILSIFPSETKNWRNKRFHGIPILFNCVVLKKSLRQEGAARGLGNHHLKSNLVFSRYRILICATSYTMYLGNGQGKKTLYLLEGWGVVLNKVANKNENKVKNLQKEKERLTKPA